MEIKNFMIKEIDLDRAFAAKIEGSQEFIEWLISKTKYRNLIPNILLLKEDQIKLKPRKKSENWWRHWWCRLDDGTESETDIFLVFYDELSKDRIAFHIENKPPQGKFTPNQYLNYDRRGRFMLNKKAYMNYSDFTTILLAPNSFINSNADQVKYFETIISYEEVGQYIALFKESLVEAQNQNS